MNKEEIEELKEFTIDLTDIDELALGLEICSKKSNMVIQEFIDTILQLQQENQQLKERINKAIEYINDNVAVYAFNNKEYPHWEFNDDDDMKELLEILKGDSNEN